MKNIICLCGSVLITCSVVFGMTDPNKLPLEKEVAEILKQSNVDQRKDVEKIFQLGDIYLAENNPKQAAFYYISGLQVESWNLTYQLKLAQLLQQDGKAEQAKEKAQLVYNYAEQEDLILKAKSLLLDLKVKLPNTAPAEIPDTINIAIVPIGSVNMTLIDEIAPILRDKIKVNIVLCRQFSFEPGNFDRNNGQRYIDNLYRSMPKRMGQAEFMQMKAEFQVKDKDLQDYTTKKNFVRYVYKKVLPKDQYQEFNSRLMELEQDGQYDATRLISLLEKNTDLHPALSMRGYIGITEEDIYSDDSNFLFGQQKGQNGVMSYHRFTAAFNDSQPDRSKLRDRSAKQLISNVFHIFGIPRCTSPLCARAYPNSLEEHDRKSTEICSWCKEQLNLKIHKQNISSQEK
jgi:predicted Zn-dependent protease